MDKYFGIDIAKANFLSFSGGQPVGTVPNSKKGIALFLKTLPEGAAIGLEATGGYGCLLADMAYAAGFTVYVLQPAKVKRFRQSGPYRGKTDRIDAQTIRDYLAAHQGSLHPYKPLPEFEARLRKLSRIRHALVAGRAKLKMQLESLGEDPKTVKATLCGLAKRVKDVTRQMTQLLAQAPESEWLLSIPGVGPCTAAAVLPALRTIAFKGKYALDSFAGMDLCPNESGKFKGRRHMSKQGDKCIRRACYMAAFSACRSKVWIGCYQKLLAKGLKKIQALNALARKILHTIFGVFKAKTMFIAPS